jgi:hypothetical protein
MAPFETGNDGMFEFKRSRRTSIIDLFRSHLEILLNFNIFESECVYSPRPLLPLSFGCKIASMKLKRVAKITMTIVVKIRLDLLLPIEGKI